MSEYALRLANSQDTAARVRAADALGLTPNGAVRARGGLRPDGGGAVSVLSGQMNVQVTPFSCWVDASPAGQVGYPFVCDATKTLAIAAGHATLVRVDTVAVVVKENAFDGSGATTATLQIVQGTPGAGAPAMPTSACIPLRDINVPAGASAGSGGLTSGALGTDRRVYTTALGGTLPCTSTTRPASPYAGMRIFETDTKREYVYDGTAWAQAYKIQHIASGNRLDSAVAATSHPDGLRLVAGQQSISFSGGGGTLTFPAGAFPNGVLSVVVTTLSGSATAAVVASGSVTKTQASVVISGLTGTAVLSYMALGY